MVARGFELPARPARSGPCGRPTPGMRTRARRARTRVGVQQEPARQLGPAEPADGLAVARGGEVEQAEPLEDRRVGHGRVERRHELFGRRRAPRCVSCAHRPRARPCGSAPGACARGVEQPGDAEQGQRETRSRAADRSRPRPRAAAPSSVPATVAQRKRTRGVCTNGRAARAARNCRAPRAAREQPVPCRRAFGKAERARHGSVSAAPALVMPLLKRRTQIQPPGKHVVDGRVVDRIRRRRRRSGRARPSGRTPSKCVYSPCVGGSQRSGASREAERALQEAARAAGVDHEPGLDPDPAALRACPRGAPGAVVTDRVEAQSST